MTTMIFRRSLLSLAVLLALAVPRPGDKYSLLQVEAGISPRRLARGQEGRVVLRFNVREGIAISPVPWFTIELNPSDALTFSKDFFTSSDLEMEVFESEGKEFLNLKNQVAIPLTVKREARRGSHVLRGRVKYFAYSREEGWYLKETTRFSASFYTSNTVYRK